MFSKQGFITNIFSLLIVAVSQAAFAQDNLGEDSTVRYPAIYFSEWAPVTAQDMLVRIPGLDAGGGFVGHAGVAEIVDQLLFMALQRPLQIPA